MKEPIRIAHVIGKLNAAGVEAVINNYYRHIDHDRYQFDFYIDSDGECQPPEELIRMGARYFVIPPYQKLPQHLRELRKRFRENRYPIVHSGMNTLAVFSLYAAKKAGVPIRINHNHSTASPGEWKKNLFKYMLRPFAKTFATHYCACSAYAGEWLFGEKAVRENRVRIFNNAIDTEKFRFDPAARAEVRKEFGLGDSFVIGHVGRFCYQKNQEFLLEVFRIYHERHPESKLMLVGIGETRERIRETARALGLEKDVLFTGARTDVHRIYQGMDYFLLPSRYEGLGLVAVEAQCAGLPVIASDAVPEEAGATDHIAFLGLGDPQKWAEAIEKTGTRSREVTIDKRFDIRSEAKKLEEYYDEALGALKGQ